jgi:nucleoside-diphosphate-sugar epimerase
MVTVNIGSGVSIQVGQIIDIILAEAGRQMKVVVDPAKIRTTERENLCASTDRLKKLIGYVPEPAGSQTIRSILTEAHLSLL